jgi:Lrp/AsnC family transcriptional regulator for asnA, asnC and gidA
VSTEELPSRSPLDETDRSIVEQLQEDGRRSFREIGRKLGISERTVRGRVRNLRDAGVLRILAFVDPKRFGPSVLALVFLRVESDAHDELVATLAGWPEVSYVSSLLGRKDICLQVVCFDNDQLWDLVNHRLRSLRGVLETETMIEMRVHKFRYSSPHGGE